MKVGNHIEVSDFEGRCLLSVQDAELHDFIEDFVVCKEFEAQTIFPTAQSATYKILFASGISLHGVLSLLSELDLQEVDRVANINNKHLSK
jgi:hypothetical protein